MAVVKTVDEVIHLMRLCDGDGDVALWRSVAYIVNWTFARNLLLDLRWREEEENQMHEKPCSLGLTRMDVFSDELLCWSNRDVRGGIG